MRMIPSSIMLPQILTTKDHIFNYLRMNKCIILDRPQIEFSCDISTCQYQSS